jgi:hypothetical protein
MSLISQILFEFRVTYKPTLLSYSLLFYQPEASIAGSKVSAKGEGIK